MSKSETESHSGESGAKLVCAAFPKASGKDI